MPRPDELVSPASIERAHQALASVAVDTPLLPAWWLQEEIGAEVRLKCENLCDRFVTALPPDVRKRLCPSVKAVP